jgi:3-hydroxy acid dehydrogenase/malonic semialdehyde reductase
MSVFITGASSGIGAACAKAFAIAGFDLILVARRTENLKKISDDLSFLYGVKVSFYTLDVRDRASLDKLFSENKTEFDRVTVLVNNAGLAKGLDPMQSADPEDWDQMIDTNIKGLLYCTRAFLPQMVSRKSGHIVNLGSVAGHWVYEKGSVYCATKFAVAALTEGLRLDLHGTGVRITSITPGMVKTEFSEVRLGDSEKAKAVYAGRRPLSPEDIAEAVLWSVQRPSHVNIQEIVLYPTDQSGVHAKSK